MKYYKIYWEHGSKDDPVLIFGEISDESWETRRVEVFQDESMRFTDGKESYGTIRLAESKMDAELLDVNSSSDGEDVRITYINKDEFENTWHKAHEYSIKHPK